MKSHVDVKVNNEEPYLKLLLHQGGFIVGCFLFECAQRAVELRQRDLRLAELVVLHQRLVDQDVLGLWEDKRTFLNTQQMCSSCRQNKTHVVDTSTQQQHLHSTSLHHHLLRIIKVIILKKCIVISFPAASVKHCALTAHTQE